MNASTNSGELKKKATSIIFFLLLFYVLPLIAKPELIFNWQVIFLAAICSLLFATQPRLSIAEAKQKKASDRNTIWLIILVSGIGQIASLIEWAYFPEYSNPSAALVMPFVFEIENVTPIPSVFSFLNWTSIGATFLIAGTGFRLYAIHVLGNYFSATVQIKEEHKIILAGPYKFLRHPSYTGAYIAMLGNAIFLHSFIGVLIFGIGMLVVYHLRIKTEEQTLTNQFGIFYKLYASRTYKMFPMVW